MYTLHEALPPPDAHHSAPATISGPASGPATGGNGGLSSGVCPPRRHRRHDLARDAEHTPTTDPLHGPQTGSSRPSPDSRRAESAAPRGVVAGNRACQNPHHAVRAADGDCHGSIIRWDFASSIVFGERKRRGWGASH